VRDPGAKFNRGTSKPQPNLDLENYDRGAAILVHRLCVVDCELLDAALAAVPPEPTPSAPIVGVSSAYLKVGKPNDYVQIKESPTGGSPSWSATSRQRLWRRLILCWHRKKFGNIRVPTSRAI